MAWRIRADDDFDIPIYDIPERFSIRLHHDGELTSECYKGGKVTWIDNLDKDFMSLQQIDAIADKLGYKGTFVFYYYKEPLVEFAEGVKWLEWDSDVTDMCEFVGDHSIIDMFFEHLDPMEAYERHKEYVDRTTRMPSAVNIEMLEEEEDEDGQIRGTNVTVNTSQFQRKSKRQSGTFTKIEDKRCRYEEVQDSRVGLEASNVQQPANEENVEGGEGDGEGAPEENVQGDGQGAPEENVQGFNEDPATDLNEAGGEGDGVSAAANELPDDFVDEDYGPDDDHVTFRRFVEESIEVQDRAEVQDNSSQRDGDERSQQRGANTAINQDLNVDELADEDEEYNTEELDSDHGSDDEGNRKKWPVFNEETDMQDPKFVLGLIFSDAVVFRKAIRMYSIKHGFGNMRFVRNEAWKLNVVCDKGCPWKVRAGKMHKQDTLQVKKINRKHTCTFLHDNNNVLSRWITAMYVEKIKMNPTIPVDSFLHTVEAEWNVNVSRMKVYRALKESQKIIQGTYREQYSRVRDYCAEILRSNPGSTAKVSVEDGNFKRLYMCLSACKKGFKKGCRPLLGLDGCHLKGVFGGQLLSAVGVDANEETWVVAYAVVEIENKDSWTWFLNLLADDLDIVYHHGFTFISDQQKGLLPALKDVLPNSHHRFCVRHMYTNFCKDYKGLALKNALWKCARSTTPAYFKLAMEDLRRLNDKAHGWLEARPSEHWSRAFFSTYPSCDMLLNNLCESFNAVIGKARDKPILTMMEMIRTMLMKRIQVRRDKMRKHVGTIICPKVMKKVEANKIASAECRTIWNGGHCYQVCAGGINQYSVDLKERTCTCRRYQLTGIPCVHTVAALRFTRQRAEDFVHPCYTKTKYFETYECLINPVNGMRLWEVTDGSPIAPPQYNRQPGRPKMKRKKGADEMATIQEKTTAGEVSTLECLGRKEQTTIKCSNCHKTGHNSRTCHRNLPPRERPATRSSQGGTVESSTSAPSLRNTRRTRARNTSQSTPIRATEPQTTQSSQATTSSAPQPTQPSQ